MKDNDCKQFLWDVDWYYCEAQEKEIDPTECQTCTLSDKSTNS